MAQPANSGAGEVESLVKGWDVMSVRSSRRGRVGQVVWARHLGDVIWERSSGRGRLGEVIWERSSGRGCLGEGVWEGRSRHRPKRVP